IALFIPNFPALNAAGYTFTWNVIGYASQIASEGTTEISFADTGNYNVILNIQTPMGCVLTSGLKMITIPPSNYSGNIVPAVVNICEGQAFSGLTFTSTGTTTPHKVVWMNGSEVAGVTAPSTPFFPTESGLYWMMFEDANGCRFANNEEDGIIHSDVTIRKRPYVDIIGSETLCFGETMTLIGDVTDDTLQRR